MQCLVNPLCLFLLVWGVAGSLYVGGVCAGMFPSPGMPAVGAVLLNIVAFSLGCLTAALFHGLEPAGRPLTVAPPLTAGRLTRALKFTLAMGLVALLFELYRIVVIAYYFETTWLYLVTNPELFRIRLVMFIGENIFRTSYIAMLLSLTSSLFSIGFVLLGVFLYVDRTARRYLYLAAFLALSLTIGLIHLSRYEVTSNVLYLILAYCFMHALNRSGSASAMGEAPGRGSSAFPFSGSALPYRASHLQLLIPVAVIVLLFGVIDALLHKSDDYDPSSLFRGFVFQVYWYIAAPLAAFNEFVTTFGGEHQWGQNTFLPLYKWLCRFQLAQETEVAIYGRMVYVPHAVNVYTYLRNFYEDFGILGVAIAPYLLGWAATAARARACRHFQYLNLYLVLLLFVLFSFYNYFLISNQIYLQILFGFVLFRYAMPAEQGTPDRQ